MQDYFVYIAANRHRTVLYTGVTNNLTRRVAEHRAGIGSRFASRYRVRYLLYFECFREIRDAIAREKEIKGWRREKKLALIRHVNPTMEDLAGDIF